MSKETKAPNNKQTINLQTHLFYQKEKYIDGNEQHYKWGPTQRLVLMKTLVVLVRVVGILRDNVWCKHEVWLGWEEAIKIYR